MVSAAHGAGCTQQLVLSSRCAAGTPCVAAAGLTLEGCRWDEKLGQLEESRPKELFCAMPCLHIRAVPAEKADLKDVYQVGWAGAGVDGWLGAGVQVGCR